MWMIQVIYSRQCGRYLNGATGEFKKNAKRENNGPVRMVWNALSTFEASSADVSINDSPFSAAEKSQHAQYPFD